MENVITIKYPEQTQTFEEISSFLKTFKGAVSAFTKDHSANKKDNLSFMKVFTFPKVDDIKTTLEQTKKYTKEQISDIVEGLEDFPEYKK